MTRFRHDLILRMIKLLDAVLVTNHLQCAGIYTMLSALHRRTMQRAITWSWHCSLCCSSSLDAYMTPF